MSHYDNNRTANDRYMDGIFKCRVSVCYQFPVFSGLCHDELSHQCTVIFGEKYRIFRLFYSLKYVRKYIFIPYLSTILFRISVQHFAGIFPKHYSRDEVLLFLAPVRKIIKIFTTLVRKKYDWICSVNSLFQTSI